MTFQKDIYGFRNEIGMSIVVYFILMLEAIDFKITFEMTIIKTN